MTVVAIHLADGRAAPPRAVDSAEAVTGKGLVGDRYFFPDGAPSGRAITLVEEENVQDVGLEAGASRRQVTVRGIDLNALVGKRFRVGAVECYGVELCEPCTHLESLTRPGIIKDLVHRAGLNADVLTDGTIAVGDELVEL